MSIIAYALGFTVGLSSKLIPIGLVILLIVGIFKFSKTKEILE